MTYIIGVDCHITLAHASIDSGVPFGFIVDQSDRLKLDGVRVNREIASDNITQLWVYFDVILADRLLNPDGSFHADTRAQMYSKLLQYLSMSAGIDLTTPAGTLLNLGALGFTADERHSSLKTIIKVQLNNVGYYWPPVDPNLLLLSVWDGTLTWATSYWR